MEMSNNKQEDHWITVVCSLKYLQAQRKLYVFFLCCTILRRKFCLLLIRLFPDFASRLIPYFASRLLLLVNNMAAEFFSYWQYVFWQKKLSMLIWCLTFDLHWLARYSSESSWCQSVGWSIWGDVLMGVTELLAYDDGAPSWYQPYVLLVKKVTELLAGDGAPSLGYDMEGMFLIVRGICTQQICGKQGEQWKKAPWSQVCVCHGTAANLQYKG